MQFSVTSTEKNGLIQSCERKCNLGVAGISGNSALLVDFTNYINETSKKVWALIFQSYGGWIYDDDGQTGVPETTQTTTANTSDYTFPTGAIAIRGVEVKDTSGIWNELEPITLEQILERGAESEFFKTPANPLYYRLVGDTLRLYPAPNYTQASSIKVFYDRGSVAFLSTDTTATPGFASEFHDILAIGASLQWAKIKTPESPLTAQLKEDYAIMENALRNFYVQRWKNLFPPRITVKDAIREYR